MSNKLFYLICLAFVLFLAGFAQAELLVNPGFEAGLEGWKTWGGGSGSGAGGWFYNSDTHATVMEDGTAHGGEKYVEIGIADMADSWWAVSLVFQEHPVTEGNIYQISAWFRDGDADGAPSIVANGGMLQWEWRDAAPIGDPNTDERGEMVERITHNFDLTEEWTYVSATEVAPPGAKGATVIFGTTWGGINLDVDDTSYVEVIPTVPIPVQNAGFEDPVLAEDDWTWLDVPGWTPVGGEGPGVWNVTVSDFDPVVAPEGQNVLYTENAVGDAGGVAQVLTETFAANTDYTLTVEVGNSWAYYWSGYSVQLLAGGIVIAEDNDTLWPDYMLWATSTVVYTYDPADSALVGQPLEIRLLTLALDKDNPPADEVVGVEFDNVTLSYVEEPEEIVGTIFLADDFESYADDAELAAAGWTIHDTNEAIEASTWTITNPADRTNPATLDGSASTGKFLISDSDQQSESNPVDSGASHDVSTPSFSTLGYETVWLHADVSAQLNNNGSAIFDVEVSTDSGDTWTNVFSRVAPGRASAKGATTRLPDNTNTDGYFGCLDVDLSAVAPNEPDVQVRFRHFEPSWDWWIAIDNILINDVPAPQGGNMTVFSEDFSNGLGQMNVVSGQGNTGTETWHTSDKGGRYVPSTVGEQGVNRLGPHPNELPEFAILDSDANPDPNEDEWLMTPSLDLSGLVEVFLHYESETVMSGGVWNQEVLVSLDGGSTFEAAPIFAYTGGGLFDNGEEPVYAERIFDVSVIVAGQSQVVFAFRFAGDGDDWWWAIDNVKVSGVAPGPVGHWTLDEGAGTTVADVSGNGNDGTIMDNPDLDDPTWIAGISGSALEFHGTGVAGTGGDHIDCGNDASLDITGPISIALWIRPDADDPEGKGTSGGETAPMAKATSDWSWQVRYGWGGAPTPYMSFTFNTSPRAWISVGRNLVRNDWVHIACSYDGTTLKCYLDGAETDSTPMGEIASSVSPVLIGSDGWGSDWIGAIDDVRIYDRALSEDEILDIVADL